MYLQFLPILILEPVLADYLWYQNWQYWLYHIDNISNIGPNGTSYIRYLKIWYDINNIYQYWPISKISVFTVKRKRIPTSKETTKASKLTTFQLKSRIPKPGKGNHTILEGNFQLLKGKKIPDDNKYFPHSYKEVNTLKYNLIHKTHSFPKCFWTLPWTSIVVVVKLKFNGFNKQDHSLTKWIVQNILTALN